MSEIQNRYDAVLLFDVKDGNPNGDPDAGNNPRQDPDTNQGLVSDVCLKRKVRNYVQLTRGERQGFDIFVKERSVLNRSIEAAFKDSGIDLESAPQNPADGKKRKTKGAAQRSERDTGRDKMCERYFDVRAFGAVMSTGANAGQVRGPVQVTFARSIDPVVPAEHSITRMAVTTEEDSEEQSGGNRTMGRKFTIPYGLYRAHVFISPFLARQTHFSVADLDLLWQSFQQMFEHDRSAARGLMSLQQLIVFRHDTELGSAPAHRLFDLVTIKRRDESKPARDFSDYAVTVGAPPAGVTIMEPGLAAATAT